MELTIVRVYKIYLVWNVSTWIISEVRVYNTGCLCWHILMSLTSFLIKLRYNLVSLFAHYSTYWIDSATVILHKVKTFMTDYNVYYFWLWSQVLRFIFLNPKYHHNTNKPTILWRWQMLHWQPRTSRLRWRYYNTSIRIRPHLDLHCLLLELDEDNMIPHGSEGRTHRKMSEPVHNLLWLDEPRLSRKQEE